MLKFLTLHNAPGLLTERRQGMYIISAFAFGLAALVPLLWLVGVLKPGVSMIHVASYLALALGFATAMMFFAKYDRYKKEFGLVAAIGLVAQVSFLVYAVPDAWRTDMHMLYFVILALLVGLYDPIAIIAATLTVAVHHFGLGHIQPSFVFAIVNGNASDTLIRGFVHAVILILEAVALVVISSKMACSFQKNQDALKVAEEARLAHEKAEALRSQNDTEKATREARMREAQAFVEDFGKAMVLINAASATLKKQMDQALNNADVVHEKIEISAQTANGAVEHIDYVAEGAFEIVSSVSEIGKQVQMASEISKDAVGRSQASDAAIRTLAQAASKIGDVVKLISDIAGQTNLLALNATIEAARAGEAGKGFAVVASEVKALAAQTAKATEEISLQVEAIQSSTNEAVQQISGVTSVVSEVDRVAGAIADAVQNQEKVTQGISEAVQKVSNASKTTQDATKDGANGIQGVIATVKSLEVVMGDLDKAIGALKKAQDEAPKRLQF